MVNSKHSVKFKSTQEIGLHSSSRKMNDKKATPKTSTQEMKNPLKKLK